MSIIEKEIIYKSIKGADLILRIYFDSDLHENEKRPAVVFYFGGGWKTGSIDQFSPQCRYLADNGFVCITPEYRITSKHDSTPFDSFEDAKDSIFWIYQNHISFHIDPERIAVAGGSAGGHLAACLAVLRNDERKIYSIPKAMILLNAVYDTSKNGWGFERLGERSLELSPLHNITNDLPPTLILHGTKDSVVPYKKAIEFNIKLIEAGNDSTLIGYEGRGHGFFNKKDGPIDYLDTLYRMEEFLNKNL